MIANLSQKKMLVLIIVLVIVMGLTIILFSPHDAPWSIPIVLLLLWAILLLASIVIVSTLQIEPKISRLVILCSVGIILLALHTLRQLTMADVILVVGIVSIIGFYLKGR